MRLICLVALFFAGCAGPSRARYAELLHECRESNREHLRMIQLYDQQADRFAKNCVPMKAPGHGWACEKDIEFLAPEQKAGTAEMGLGGF